MHLWAAFEEDVDSLAAERAKKDAIDVLTSLFVKRRRDIDGYIKNVAVIPDIPELSSVHKLHAQHTRSLTLDENVALLCKMLSHESSRSLSWSREAFGGDTRQQEGNLHSFDVLQC